MPDQPTPERRRELLGELTREAVDAGTYGEPAPAEERTSDVPDEMLDLAWRAELARRSPGVSAELIEEYCDFEVHPSMRSDREKLRPILAAVLPEHARQIRTDAGEDTLAEFERFTVNRTRLTVQQTVNACFVSADRAKLYEEFRERIEQRVREQVAQELLAVDPAEWALAGERAGLDAARIARKEGQ